MDFFKRCGEDRLHELVRNLADGLLLGVGAVTGEAVTKSRTPLCSPFSRFVQ